MSADRQSPRKVADRILSILMEPNNHAIVTNISDEGLGFHALNPVTQSGTIRFSFSENSQRIDACGELVWTDSTKKTGGLRFTSLPRASRQRIWNWVNQAASPASTGATSEPATPPSKESPHSGVSPPQANAAPAPYAPLPGMPLPQPTGPGFALLEDDPQSTPYSWDQEMSIQESGRKFLRGFVTGAIVLAILTAILFFVYGSPNGVLLALERARIGASPVPQAAPTTAPPPVALPPPLVSSRLPSSDSTSTETPVGSAPLSPTADDSQENGAAARTATEPPLAADHVTRAHGSLPPKAADPGEADLARAQRYLGDKSGPGGRAAAARFLWAGVEKGNVAAEIALADLYARGDGVTKSCDQARVLLRAAARKGSSEASQELAQIIRGGCR